MKASCLTCVLLQQQGAFLTAARCCENHPDRGRTREGGEEVFSGSIEFVFLRAQAAAAAAAAVKFD